MASDAANQVAARHEAGALGRPRRLATGMTHGESLVAMLTVAHCGTALAGGAFPLILGVCELAMGPDGARWISDGGYFFSFSLLGAMFGCVLAFIVGVPVTLFAGAVAWVSGISGRDAWFASLVGAWTGFFAAHMMLDGLPLKLGYWTIIGLAVITGQIGAGGLVWAVRRRQRTHPSDGAPASEFRLSLRQLFGITTALALVAALAQSLRDNELAYATIGYAAMLQAVVIGPAITIGQAHRERSRAADSVPRETPTRPA